MSWQPIASFFDRETDGPIVQLRTAGGEVRGYYDPDERAWYREGEGPDLESEPILPTHWRPASDVSFVPWEQGARSIKERIAALEADLAECGADAERRRDIEQALAAYRVALEWAEADRGPDTLQ